MSHITILEIDTTWTMEVPEDDMRRAIAFGGERLKFLDHPDYKRFRLEPKTFDDLIDALLVVSDEARKSLWADLKRKRDNERAAKKAAEAAKAKA